MEYLRALCRLLFIAMAVLFAVTIPLFVARHVALSSQVFQADLKLWARPFWFFLRGDEETSVAFSRQGFLSALKVLPEGVLMADLRPTKDQQWVVFGRARLEDHTSGRGGPENYSLEALKRLHLKNGDAIMSLPEFLLLAPSSPIALTIHSRESLGAHSLAQALGDSGTHGRTVIIVAQAQSLLRELRKKQPEWRFSADVSALTKLELLSSLYIEPLLDIPADFVVAPLRHNNSPTLSPRSIAELLRRKKPLFLEDTGDQQIPRVWAENLAGVMTARPRWAKEAFLR